MRLIERVFPKGVVARIWRRVYGLCPPKLLEEVRPHALRIEELLELDRRQLSDLLLGIIDAALFADAGADLLHDLLDLDRVGAHVEIRHRENQFTVYSSQSTAAVNCQLLTVNIR